MIQPLLEARAKKWSMGVLGTYIAFEIYWPLVGSTANNQRGCFLLLNYLLSFLNAQSNWEDLDSLISFPGDPFIETRRNQELWWKFKSLAFPLFIVLCVKNLTQLYWRAYGISLLDCFKVFFKRGTPAVKCLFGSMY